MHIGILGTFYCGSTILSLSVGASRRVFPLGELQDIFNSKRDQQLKGACRICDSECPFWTNDFCRTIADSPESAYQLISDRLPADTIVLHADKRLQQYIDRTAEGNRLEKAIVLFKRPEAFAYSLKTHNDLPVTRGLNNYATSYSEIREWTERQNIPALYVFHERFSRETESVLGNICEFLEIDFEPEMLSFWQRKSEMHMLAGNSGAYAQLLSPDQFDSVSQQKYWQDVYSDEHLKWIKDNHKSISVDEKWKNLDPAEIEVANSHDRSRQEFDELRSRERV